MPQSVVQRGFAAGELAPALHARADLVKYTQGLRTCRNLIVQRHGGVTNRPGTRFVAPCKTNDSTVKLLRYVSEVVGESQLIECGDGYVRFYVNGAPLAVDGGAIDAWDVAIDYAIGDLVTDGGTTFYALKVSTGLATTDVTAWYPFVADLFELPSPFGSDLPNWGQSGRVITLTHKDHPPYELVNGGGLTSWILRPVSTAATIAAPVGLAVASGGGAGTRTIGYVVTAAAADTYEESIASAQVVNAAVLGPTPDVPDVLTWTAVPGAAEYYVYADPYGNGTYGFIGIATGATTFRATGVAPDFLSTPPTAQPLFDAAGKYPHVSAVFQQRRLFGYTNQVPDGVYGSRTGLPSNFGISTPLQDDDAITFRLAGNTHNPVKHLLGLKTLIVLTSAGGWVVTGGAPGAPLTPSGIDANQELYTGAGDPVPVIVGNAILYVQARGRLLFDVQFDQQVAGLGGRDLSIFADHLFAGFTLNEIDYAQTPDSIVWAIRSDGTLLGLTYIRDQDVWGWHRHDTGASGRFEHVCVVPEAVGDTVYFIVRRTIGGVTQRYIESLSPRLITTFDLDAFFVDAGLTYVGAPVTHFSGLDHLNGQRVAAVADGSPVWNTAIGGPYWLVAGGAVTLPVAGSLVHLGLPIVAELETLDLDVAGSAIRDKKKRVGSVTLLLEASARTFQAGPDPAHLTRVALAPYETQADQYTGPAEVNITSAFNDGGRVFVRHTDPLPFTVLGVIPNLEVGG